MSALPQVLIKMQISVPHLRPMKQIFSKGNLKVFVFHRPKEEDEPILRRDIFSDRVDRRYRDSESDRF